MKGNPAISIVVPAYNEEKLIGRCLTSLTKQDFPLPYEIIVVDNNSTDRTQDLARTFNTKIVYEQQQGVVYARQRGLKAAKGDIIVGADCDCIYPPEYLHLVYTHFQKNPDVVVVGGPGKASETNPYWGYLIYIWGFALIYTLYRLTGKVIYLLASNFAYRRKVFLALGGYHTYLPLGGGDEWHPLWRLQRVGKAVFEPQAKSFISLRRYRVGFIKFLFLHTLYYYVLAFILALLTKKAVIGNVAVRD